MSPFWKPTMAAAVFSSTPITATPSCAWAMENSSAVAGEILTTLAPAKGEAPVILTRSRGGRSGAAVSLSGTTAGLPSRRIDSDATPPSGFAPSR